MPDIVLDSVFQEFAALLLLAALIGYIGTRLKQPLIVSFIAVGILLGPSALDWMHDREAVHLLSEVGITLLLFVVGLKLDLHLIRTMGPVALATGMGQVIFTSVVGYGIAVWLGFAPLTALYIAVALTFSSTIIIVKLLSDKREIDSLHGRIAVGFLIVQDIVVVLVLILLAALAAGEGESSLHLALISVLVKGVLLLVGVGLLMRYVLPWLLGGMARSQELLVLFSIALAVALASLGDVMGFSKEVGAFLAGIALASTPYREAIGSRLTALRDFLLLFFFISLGAQLNLGTLGAQVGPALIFSAFVLIGNPLIVMAIMGIMGYRRRTGFLAGLTVAQISEFSLILVAMGLAVGHIDQDTVGLVTLVGLITIGLSTYMILYSHGLYQRLAPFLGMFERRIPHREQDTDGADAVRLPEIVIFGLGRFGTRIATELHARGVPVLGVDFDPAAIADLQRRGIPACYGDAEDPEFFSTLPLGAARWVVATMPILDTNLMMIDALRSSGYSGRIAVTAHDQATADRLAQAHPDLVLLPFADAAERTVLRLVTEHESG
ncbi:MAG: cation:proton antiporter family protein [Aquisalimonadaceae bacterium]